jgi:hypothetical protein
MAGMPTNKGSARMSIGKGEADRPGAQEGADGKGGADRTKPIPKLLQFLASVVPPAAGGIISSIVLTSSPMALSIGGGILAGCGLSVVVFLRWKELRKAWCRLRTRWKRVTTRTGRRRRRRSVIAFGTAALLGVLVTIVVIRIIPSDCGTPTELTILTSQEVDEAVQSTLRDFERYEARNSSCYLVHLTAYPAANTRQPGDIPGMRSVEAQFAKWLPSGLLNIGARPDVWISDSPYDVELASKALRAAGQSGSLPTLEQRGPIAESPLVIGLPNTLVDDSLKNLVQGNGWQTVYPRLRELGVTLAMPDPASSDTGLFQLTDLDQSLGQDQGLRAVTAVRDFAPDSMSVLCSALQAAENKHSALPATAYLVSEAALASYNAGKCGSPPGNQKLRPFYPLGTRPLRFTFTSVHWGGRQEQVRSRYAADFYSWLADRDGGGKKLEKAGLSRLSTPSSKDGPGPNDQARQALAAFEAARPSAQVLIGIDASKTMAPNLAPIDAAVGQALGPTAGPVGSSDTLAIWRLPGPKGETQTTLIGFQPGTPDNRKRITSQLRGLGAGGHSAVYDMLIDAGTKLRTLPNATPAGAPAPIQAVVLLTDGDGYARQGKDPHGATIDSVTTAFTPGPDSRPIKLYVIAFGPIGCQGPLGELAHRNHGECQDATVPDLGRQLAQVLSRLAKGA